MTYALRETRSLPPHALAAPIAQELALMAIAALGLSGDPFHEPFHAERPGASGCLGVGNRSISGQSRCVWGSSAAIGGTLDVMTGANVSEGIPPRLADRYA
jgi:hypothetical protein